MHKEEEDDNLVSKYKKKPTCRKRGRRKQNEEHEMCATRTNLNLLIDLEQFYFKLESRVGRDDWREPSCTIGL